MDYELFKASFEDFYQQRLNQLCKYIQARGKNMPENVARDLADETFERFYIRMQRKNKPPIQEANWPRYLYAIARNLVADYYRERSHHGSGNPYPPKEEREDDIQDFFQDLFVDSTPGPEDAYIVKETWEIVTRAVAKLPEKYRRVVTGILEGRSIVEIAQMEHVGTAAIHARRKKAIELLRAMPEIKNL